jgi:hypothetical protein
MSSHYHDITNILILLLLQIISCDTSHITGLFFLLILLYFFCRNSPQWTRTSSFTRFLDHTQRRTRVGRTPLDEWSARRRDLYLTTHNTHIRQMSMPQVGFKPTISADEPPQTYALDRVATGTGYSVTLMHKFSIYCNLTHYLDVFVLFSCFRLISLIPYYAIAPLDMLLDRMYI